MGKVDNIESESCFICTDSMPFGVSNGLIFLRHSKRFTVSLLQPLKIVKNVLKHAVRNCSEYMLRHICKTQAKVLLALAS